MREIGPIARLREASLTLPAGWVLLLALLTLELLPSGNVAWLVVGSGAACGLAYAGFRTVASAVLGGGLLGALALMHPTIWLGTASAVLAVAGLLPARRERRLAIAITAGMGVVFPLLLLAAIAVLEPDALHALRAGARLGGSLPDHARHVALLLSFIVLSAELLEGAAPRVAGESLPRARQRIVLGVLSCALAGWLALRGAWIGSIVGLRTDMLVWSERPLLVNLLKLRAGEVFYGPPELVNSYSYSPGLELLQYPLLRPLGLELSLPAHRVLGLSWQLVSSALLLLALVARCGPPLSQSARWLLGMATLGVVCSSLLAPHVHPDHVMMVCFSVALWLVLDQAALDRRRAALLFAVPVLATCFKLTGAGIGLGLAAAYAWQRDGKRFLILAVAGAAALGTIPLFDMTLGAFSRYAIQLQASHPLEWGRALEIPSTPSGKVWVLSLGLLAVRWRLAPSDSTTRAATRAALLTAGFGVTSLLAFIKHGGRENSLLPLAIGGFVVCVLCVLADETPPLNDPAHVVRLVPPRLAAMALSLMVIATPRFEPLDADTRARFVSMHQQQVAWLKSGKARQLRLWTSSVAAYIDSGERTVPRDVLSSAVELELGRQAAFAGFAQRIAGGFYDGLALQSTLINEAGSWSGLATPIRQRYRVVGPPELAGQWPQDRAGYVLLEKPAP